MSQATVFSAVADPTRREMLDLLSEGPLSAGEIVSHFSDLTQPGISRHLRVLREAQLVNVTVRAQQRIYALKPEGLRELHEWIAKYREFWIDKMDALEEHLNREKFKKTTEKKRR